MTVSYVVTQKQYEYKTETIRDITKTGEILSKAGADGWRVKEIIDKWDGRDFGDDVIVYLLEKEVFKTTEATYIRDGS